MSADAFTRRLFLIAVALIAAAIADPVVESLANAGIVGGHYCDNNHITVIPALLVGALFGSATLLLRWRDGRRCAPASGEWLGRVAKDFSGRPPARDLPYVFLVQMIALFGMESAEQLVVGGRLLGGTTWLGGPILFSLFTHALVGAICLRALGSFMRALLRTVAALVNTLRTVWLALVRATCIRPGRAVPPLRHQWDAVRYSCGRAPPLLRTTA